MTTYLLTWNPERWTWDTFGDDVARASSGEIVEMEWSTGNTKKIAPGDRLFLLRQGTDRPGIVGAGVAIQPVRSGPHFDANRRAAGDTALYTIVRFEQLLPIDDVLSTSALKKDRRLGAFGWKPAASGMPLPEDLEDALEERWAKHLDAHDIEPLELHARFRAIMERAFAARPRRTPKGALLTETRVAKFGTTVGPHAPMTCWLYERRSTNLWLWLGFYENFTENDLICRVLPKGEIPNGEDGATIQFNGTKSVEPHAVGGLAFRHVGDVTVGTRVSRADLAELIETNAPAEAEALGGFDAKRSWPFRIGTTVDLDSFLDRLFEYVFVVEQAKRARRGDPLFGSLRNPVGDADSGPPVQGYAIDVEVKRAVELHAVEGARAYFERLGYDVEDHSGSESYDLLASKGKDEIAVEVKGTQGAGFAVLLTANEVAHARSRFPHVALVVVRDIEVDRTPAPVARGGHLVVYWPWDVDEHALVPKSYLCELDADKSLDPEDI